MSPHRKNTLPDPYSSDRNTRCHILLYEPSELYGELLLRWLRLHRDFARIVHIASWEESLTEVAEVDLLIVRSEVCGDGFVIPEAVCRKYRLSRVVVFGEIGVASLQGYPVHPITLGRDLDDLCHELKARFLRDKDKILPDQLSPKELEVATLTSKGVSLKEIAEQMDCSVSTIQTYKDRALEKLGLTSIADLCVVMAAHAYRDCPCRSLNPEVLRKLS